MTLKSSIQLNALQLDVFLGWPKDEREQKQSVFADVYLRFQNPPVACATDNLSDTVCYDTLIKKIKHHTDARHFRLLEYLANDVYQIIKQQVATDIAVGVRLTKKPTIENLTGGVSFYYGDEESFFS